MQCNTLRMTDWFNNSWKSVIFLNHNDSAWCFQINEAHNISIYLFEMTGTRLGIICACMVHTHRICSLSEAAAEMALWCPLHWKNYLTVTIARSNEITEMDSPLCDLRSKVENIFLSLSWSFRWTLFASMCAFIRLSCWFDPVCHLIYSGFASGDNQGITRNYFTMTHTYHILLWK